MKKPEMRKCVLIVEDQAADIVITRELTHQLGLQATLAFDAVQAFELCRRQKFDLVILDWLMPHGSGEEFLSWVSESETIKEPIKIILHTSENLRKSDFPTEVGYKVLDVWRKPMGPLEMLKRLKMLSQT